MKKRLTAGLLALLSLLCAGCGGQTQEAAQPEEPQQETVQQEGTQQEGPVELYEPDGEWLEAENDWRLICPSYLSAQEAANMEYVYSNPIFILHDGRFYNLEPVKMIYSYPTDWVKKTVDLDALPMSGSQLPTVDLAAGDKLVTFSEYCSDYGFVPIEDKGACLPVIWRSGVVNDVLTEVYPSNAEFKIGDYTVTEIQGQSFEPYTGSWGVLSGQSKAQHEEKVRNADDEFCNALSSAGLRYYAGSWIWSNGDGLESGLTDYTDYVIQGNYGDVITLGQYQGTQYVESGFNISSTLYEIDVDNVQDTGVEKTHDGYFVVDIPDSVSGTWAIRTKMADGGIAICYAISVVR